MLLAMAASGAANPDNHAPVPITGRQSDDADQEEEEESGSEEEEEESDEEDGDEEEPRNGWERAWRLLVRFPCRLMKFFQVRGWTACHECSSPCHTAAAIATGIATAASTGLTTPLLHARQDHPFTFVEIMVWFLYYVLGVVYYTNVEGWSTQTCLYFITVTVSTIGYGQYGPTSDDARIFTSFYCVFGILCVLTAINRAATRWLVKVQRPILDLFLGKKIHSPTTKITFSLFVVLMVLLVGCTGFSYLEGWDSAQAFYWTVTTMTTVGYGDLRVQNEATRQFGIFFIYLCMFVYSLAIHNIMTSFQDIKDRSKRLAAVVDIRKTGIFKRSMVANSLSEFLCEEDCSEFVLSTLLRMNKVSIVEDCEPIIKYWIQQRALLRQSRAIAEDERREGEEEEDPDFSDHGRGGSSQTDMTSATSGSSGSRLRGRGEVASKVEDFLAMAEQRRAVALLEEKDRVSRGSREGSASGGRGSSSAAPPVVQNPLLGGRSSNVGDRALSSDGL